MQIELDGLGGVWATEQDGNRIARLDPLSGQWEEYSIPTPDSQPWGLVLDGAGHLWVAEQAGNRIARFDTVQRVWVEEHQVPTPASRPYDLVVGPFGRIWFTESAGRKLGELDPITGAIVEHDPLSQPDPVEVDQPGSIASHDLDVWFTDPERDQLVRFYAYLGRFYRFWPPTAGCGPQDVAVSPEGDVWITEGRGDKVALMSWSTNGDWYEYEVASEGSEPYGITLTRYEVWFTERLGDRLGHWSGPWLPAEHSLPSPGSQPTDVAVDSQGCVWYAAPGSNALGRMCLEYVHSTYLPVLAWEAAKP